MKCDIIIPIWNQLEATKTCIESIKKNTHYTYRLILIDNGSSADTKSYLEDLKEIEGEKLILIRNDLNLGFIKAINQGLKYSDAPYICIMNNDTEPALGWLGELVNFAEKNKHFGLLNPLCNGHLQKNMTINEYALSISSSNKDKFMEMNQCQGFCMLIKREVMEKIGYLDERFGIGGFDDTDYSMRAHKAGCGCACVYSSYVYHKEHKSFDAMGKRKKIQEASEKEYFKKWPRHLRIAVIFSVRKSTPDASISNFLNSSLFLAREWCWVNLFIFTDKSNKDRIEKIKHNVNFPLHQNIKFNYLNDSVKIFEIFARLSERAIGSKRRKKYDAVIYDDRKLSFIIRNLTLLQGGRAFLNNFDTYREKDLRSILGRGNGADLNNMKCDIILPVCDQFDFTKKCIESIIKCTDTPHRLIVINNGKNPKTKEFIEQIIKDGKIEITVVHNEYNIGWVKALNKGIELSNAPYVCFQNDDTVVTKGWLRKMINKLNLNNEFGLINPEWEGRPRNISIDRYNNILEKINPGDFIETDWCRGFSVVIKRAVIEKIGKVDEIYGLAYFDDVDYSVTAIESGFKALKALDTYVYHHRNVTFFEILKGPKWNKLHEKNKLIYHRKWGRPLRIAIRLDDKINKCSSALDKLENTVFYLARKQHHIDIRTPVNFNTRFRHTNVCVKFYPKPLFKICADFALNSNKKKKNEKRYNAVFNYDLSNKDMDKYIIETVDRMKEETKELINVEV